MDRWYLRLQRGTEGILTWRRKRKLKKKARQKKRHVIIEWLDAFLWAAFVVLLINQYFFQAYQIPSGSMQKTLLIKDRIFVNKLIYGPELLPGIAKIASPREPKRSQVIIFESPTYLSKGPLFDILQRILYMVTLSIVDIDRDENGNPRAHFLIKRAIGMEGDRLRIRQGEVEISPPGSSSWVSEASFRPLNTADYATQRLIRPEEYDVIHAAARVNAFDDIGIRPDPADVTRVNRAITVKNDTYERRAFLAASYYAAYPNERRYGNAYRQYERGWFVPEGWIFPMGDNRDDSNDARYFGPVRLKKVLGKAMFIYWPIVRIGAIR